MTVDDIAAAIGGLSQSQRSDLFRRFGAVISDLAYDVFVRIDTSSEEGSKAPCVIFQYPDGSKEEFDVFALIEQSLLNIAHPAVLYALERWENIIRLEEVLTLPDVYDGSFKGGQRELSRIDLHHKYGTAKKNLERLGKLLSSSAHNRKHKRSEAYFIFIEYFEMDRMNTYLYLAWQLLAEPEIKCEKISKKKLQLLEERLRRSLFVFLDTAGKRTLRKEEPEQVLPISRVISVERVLDFFRSEEGNTFFRQRRNWKSTRNAFFAWRFRIPMTDLLRGYKNRAMNLGSAYPPAQTCHLSLWERKVRLSELGNWVAFYQTHSPLS